MIKQKYEQINNRKEKFKNIFGKTVINRQLKLYKGGKIVYN
jgi:hypothetical protein